MLELRRIRPVDLGQYRRTKSLCCYHTQTPNQAADAQVYQHTFLAVPRSRPESNHRSSYNQNTSIGEESRRYDEALHLLDGRNGALLRRIEDNDDATDDTVEASDLSNEAQPLLKKYSTEYRRDDNRQRAQRCYQYSIREAVGHEIADFANDHECHARPPPSILEISIAFTSFLVVFFIRLQQTRLLEHKRGPD